MHYICASNSTDQLFMREITFKPFKVSDLTTIQEGKIGWKSPSNIAIVKYWGKYGIQLPRNASFSFTLNNAHTKTILSYGPKKEKNNEIELDLLFEGKPKPTFKPKIISFLKRIAPYLPFLLDLNLKIESSNSFPHSAGIASSASSMSALALCFIALEQELFGFEYTEEEFLAKVSFIARLGSGSACRSNYPLGAIWGLHPNIKGSSNEYAIPFQNELHPNFQNFHDDILIISKEEKEVSSTVGHALMENNPYASVRFKQAEDNLSVLVEALRKGDYETFGKITELEALTLHALMMTSEPPFILMQPNSLTAIKQIRAFRKTTGLPVYFTLDAGPNLHILYPNSIKPEIDTFINDQLISLCEGGKMVRDKIGNGPVKLV